MKRRTLRPGDEEWPVLLDELGSARPDSLRVEGRRLESGDRTIAVVGARRPTLAGCEAAEAIARGLAEAGFGVVSGLAVGIDAIAHRAALDAGGYTIGVLGCGIDVDYPRRNTGLRERIVDRGTVVTEFPDGTPPAPHNFPQRNRIIAGLAKGVIFVEGGRNSGGLITARLAADANRDVYAVPGSIRNPMAEGPNLLIREGATLITSVGHVFADVAPGLVWEPGEPAPGTAPELEPDEARVLDVLDDAPAPIDLICRATGMAFGEAALVLARLEVRGMALRRAGGYELTAAGTRARRAATPAQA